MYAFDLCILINQPKLTFKFLLRICRFKTFHPICPLFTWSFNDWQYYTIDTRDRNLWRSPCAHDHKLTVCGPSKQDQSCWAHFRNKQNDIPWRLQINPISRDNYYFIIQQLQPDRQTFNYTNSPTTTTAVHVIGKPRKC